MAGEPSGMNGASCHRMLDLRSSQTARMDMTPSESQPFATPQAETSECDSEV